MEGPRAPTEQELPRVVEFLNKNLRTNIPWSIAAEYPLALTELNRSNLRVIWEQDEVLSHAVLKPVYVRGPVGLIKAATIGSVVTAGAHRGKGLSQKILSDCLETAQKQACDVAVLWTNIYDFYRKLGFELAGSEISLIFDRESRVDLGALRVVEGTKVSSEALLRLFQNHTVNTLRTAEDISRYMQIPNSRIYTLWGPDNNLEAYIVEGKGADLGGYIHEWGGTVSKLLMLIGTIRNQRKENLVLIIPAHAQGVIRKAEELGIPMHSGYLGMIKILNPTQLFGKIKKYARNLGFNDLVLEHRDGHFYIGSGEKLFRTESENDMVRFLFGPTKPNELAQFDPPTGELLDKVFPLPFWIWGWDSV